MFQSTRPRGARPSRRSHLSHKSNVSIHAPAWGATSNSHHSYYILISFNPRARVGRDKIKKAMVKQYGKFQSTRPRGARHICCYGYFILEEVSIHAPAWGATRLLPTERDARSVSIHAPAWGATRKR